MKRNFQIMWVTDMGTPKHTASFVYSENAEQRRSELLSNGCFWVSRVFKVRHSESSREPTVEEFFEQRMWEQTN